jgi:hypothetical protein
MNCKYNIVLIPRRGVLLSLISLILLGILLLSSCKELAKTKDLSEGFIEYNIEYFDTVLQNSYNANMRPNKMVIKFKDSNTINKIEGLSGAFTFAFIQNKQGQKAYTLIKLLNKKLFYQEPLLPNTLPFAYSDMPEFSITYTDEVINMLGFNCHKAIGHFRDSLSTPFEILYTKEINVNNPNANSPFEEIDGVLLKFTAIMFGHKMNVQASNIKSLKISDEEFVIPTGYEEVGLDVVKDVIDLLR